jgi:Ni/Co efflux regulator RcnB
MDMRKLILSALIGATMLPASAATAQSYGEARRSQEQVRRERQDVRDAQRYGTRADIREERRELRDARREAREDWRDYRQRNRQLYTLPRYYAPRGYTYRPVRSGVTLRPVWYGQRYVIANPYRYRLPAAVGPQRWVRYGNDVLLVNTRNGRVLDVIPAFFY